MDYSKGNLALFQEFSFIEILEVINYMQNRENDDYLLRVYAATFAGLAGVEFSEFRKKATAAAAEFQEYIPTKSKPEEIEKKVSEILNNNKWEVRNNGG